ncbi:MAG: KdsC family phosphatase [Salibacteraceae bacterium]
MTYLDSLPKIKTFVFDVDGVLTDGTVTMLEDGSQVRHMNSKDGYAIQLAVKLGYEIVIITGGSSETVKDRLEGLGVQHVYLKSYNKKEVLADHCLTFDTDLAKTLYMGDDIPDYEVMKEVELACCPLDAAPEIKSISKFISTVNGGKGCVRDIIEQTLRVQDQWFKANQDFKNFTW